MSFSGAVGDAAQPKRQKRQVRHSSKGREYEEAKRSSALSKSHRTLSKHMGNIEELLMKEKNVENAILISTKLERLDELFNKVLECHSVYHEILIDPGEMDKISKFMQEVDGLVFQMKLEANEWVKEANKNGRDLLHRVESPIHTALPIPFLHQSQQQLHFQTERQQQNSLQNVQRIESHNHVVLPSHLIHPSPQHILGQSGMQELQTRSRAPSDASIENNGTNARSRNHSRASRSNRHNIDGDSNSPRSSSRHSSLSNISQRNESQQSNKSSISPRNSSKRSSNSSSRSSNKERLGFERVRIAELDAELEYQREISRTEELKRKSLEEHKKLDDKMIELSLKKEIAKAKARAQIFEEAEQQDDRLGRGAPEVYNDMLLDLERTRRDNLNPTEEPQEVNEDIIVKPYSPLDNISRHLLMRDAPSVEIDPFNGDPTEYHYFIATFKEAVEKQIPDSLGRLTRLIHYTTGEAKELIKNCIQEDPIEGYQNAKRLLQEQYGNPHRVASAYIKEILVWPVLKEGNSSGYRKLYRFLIKCKSLLTKGECLSELNSSESLRCLQSKLPYKTQESWNRRVSNVRKKQLREPNYLDFFDFFETEHNLTNDPMFSREAMNSLVGKSKAALSSYLIDANSENNDGCLFCKGSHNMEICSDFVKKTLPERSNWVYENKLCFGCLKKGHISKACPKRNTCSECNGKHPTVLHRDKDKDKQEEVTNCTTNLSGGVVSMSIVPVVLSSKDMGGNEKVVYAMLDNFSSGTFVDEKILADLDVEGTGTTLAVTTINGTEVVNCTAVNGLTVRRFSKDRISHPTIKLPKTYSTSSLPVKRDEIPSPKKLVLWSYLQRILKEIPEVDDSIPIGLLIGGNCPKALEPLEVIPGQNQGPFATRSALGWCVTGPISLGKKDSQVHISCNRIAVQDISTNKVASHHFALKDELKESSIEDMLKDMYMKDFNEQYGKSEDESLSNSDKKFLEIMSSGIKLREDSHYSLPLPFKQKKVSMPNNKEQAIKFAEASKRRFLKDRKFFEDYHNFMKNLINKGYAERVTEVAKDEEGKVWYLIHHGVYKGKKIRVVFNCALEYQGRSLNSELFQGPDLANSLLGVLLRFGKETIPVMADIESMFYQVFVPADQRSFLRFLWWENGLDNTPSEFQMCVHVFGAVSSPSCSNFALKRAARDNNECSEEARTTIERDFYVDDLLKSKDDPESLTKLLEEVRGICAARGFTLTKFVSNNDRVLSKLPDELKAPNLKDVEMCNKTVVVERALGITWYIQNDTFGFCIKLKDKPFTKRGMLSTISSIYDPKGLIGPFLLKGRKILQEVTLHQSAWDEPIPEHYRMKWDSWIQSLLLLEKLEINRCYKPDNFGEVLSAELHVFSDASQEGYGVACYLRQVNVKGKVHVALLMGKSRVSPTKPITIPRLELVASTVAARIGTMVKDELDIPLLTLHFWTDSQIVLGYINNENTRYRVFVANRVQIIRDYTSVDQWRYVESLSNPADHCSRGIAMTSTKKVQQWLNGPSFLWVKDIPKTNLNLKLDTLDGDPEILNVHAITIKNLEDGSWLETLSERISCWYKLKKIVAHILRFIKLVKKQVIVIKESSDKANGLSTKELANAERVIIQEVQKRHFSEELDIIRSSQNTISDKRRIKKDLKGKVRKGLKGGNALISLDPIMDEKGLLRVGGRLKNSLLPYKVKHPVILPKCNIADLIIRWNHAAVKHGGRGVTLNCIRNKGFWIIGLNSKVRRHIWKCVTCRRLRGSGLPPKMANLPKERITSAPPFTHTGVDMFGPFEVKEGRKEIKRYGCLFTCLASRAVHIEVTQSMETDSFINGLRRFIARRGHISSIRSDNGTNFVGAANELKKAWQEMNHEQIHEYLLKNGTDWIRWKRNVPSSSHMGGVWERQIRSVRSILESLLLEHGHKLNDEGLRTLMCEIEGIINSRPLTVESLSDPNSCVPLSPIQLLTQKSQVILAPPGEFERADVYGRRRWRRIQYLANEFWSKWRKEFLHTLQPRQKWSKPHRNFVVNDIVLLKDESRGRSHWPMGKIIETYPDEDGIVRQVCLRVGSRDENKVPTVLKRPSVKLILLLESTEEVDQEA